MFLCCRDSNTIKMIKKLFLPIWVKYRRKRDTSRLKPGNVMAHDNSFARHGEGDTTIKSKMSNLSQGVLSNVDDDDFFGVAMSENVGSIPDN
jgi:hypothetical protein